MGPVKLELGLQQMLGTSQEGFLFRWSLEYDIRDEIQFLFYIISKSGVHKSREAGRRGD